MSLVKKSIRLLCSRLNVDDDVVVWYFPQCHMFTLRYATGGEGVKMLLYGDDYSGGLAGIVINGRRIACMSLKREDWHVFSWLDSFVDLRQLS